MNRFDQYAAPRRITDPPPVANPSAKDDKPVFGGFVRRILSKFRSRFFDPSKRAEQLIAAIGIQERSFLGRLRRRLLWVALVRNFGCYIAVTAKIGKDLVLPNPVGIVIGEGCRVGNNVKIFQNVTLGRPHNDTIAYPTIEDDVIIHPGAVVIGDIVIGRGSVIGANSVLTKSVPPYSLYVRDEVSTADGGYIRVKPRQVSVRVGEQTEQQLSGPTPGRDGAVVSGGPVRSLFSMFTSSFLDPTKRAERLISSIGTESGMFLGRFRRRMRWRTIVRDFRCYISATARIGKGLSLPHPVGIVIGDGCRVGNNVTIFQHVTVARLDRDTVGSPSIEDDVIIYAGSAIIGDIVIGKGSIIGANSVVTKSIPRYSVCVGAPARIVRLLH